MKSYGLGWRLVFAAGLAPALAGMTMLGLALWSATYGRNDAWLSLVGQHSFSAASLEHEGKDLQALWLLTVHLCGVNLAMSGVAISAIAWFSLRNGERWAWKFLWIMILWVGVNDAVALLGYRFRIGTGFPFALIPLVIGCAGLILTRRENARLYSAAITKAPEFRTAGRVGRAA